MSWEDLGGHDFTGIYDGGSSAGLIRLSESNFLLPETGGLTPSLAIKFLRDGMESVNHLANVSFEPKDSFNFFANNFHSMVDPFTDECAIETINRKFLEYTNTVQVTGIAEFSRHSTTGVPVDDDEIVFPFRIHYEPNPELAALWPEDRQTRRNGSEIPW